MDDLKRSPGPDGPVNLVGHGQIPMLKKFGLELPLPPWAVPVIAVVGIIAVAATLALAIIGFVWQERRFGRFQKMTIEATGFTAQYQN